MKGGLCVLYTSLLTISLVSSCALFILVVSEALHIDPDSNTTGTSDLHEISQGTNATIVHDAPEIILTGNVEKEKKNHEDVQKPVLEDQEMTFTETLSLNSVTTDGLPDTGQPPVLVSLVDTATLELKAPNELLFGNDSDQHNDNKTLTVLENHAGLDDGDATAAAPPAPKLADATLIVKARSVQDPKATEEPTTSSPTTTTHEPEHLVESQSIESEKQNESSIEQVGEKPPVPQEDIPSFSEWAQKQLAEAEKHTVLNQSSQPAHSAANVSGKSGKLRSKNYASPACGAKVVAVNPEAGSASSVLSPNPDEYMLNTCNSRVWFVVELCEPVQAQRIEIANFELFSSTPKELAVYFNDRFPTREWASVGQFSARDVRDVQSFDLYPHLFGKFIKVEVLSHHGREHYCPLSLFKVYGTSEFEVLEKENQQTTHDDDDDELAEPELPAGDGETAKNLFGSARDAVMSIMKKAAQVLAKKDAPRNTTADRNDTASEDPYRICRSPSHIIVCDNCSEALYREVYELISCGVDRVAHALTSTFLRDTLKCTTLCRPFGLDFKSTKTISFSEERVSYLNAIFSKKYIASLCNILAIDEKKVVMNTSFEMGVGANANVTIEESLKTTNSVTSTEPDIKLATANISLSDNTVDLTIDLLNKESPEQLDDSDSKINTSAVMNEDKQEFKVTIKDVRITDEKPVQEHTETQVDNNTDVESPDSIKGTDGLTKDQEVKTDDVLSSDLKTGKSETVIEKPIKEGLTSTGDFEQMLLENDNFISEWNQLAVDPTPTGSPLQASQNTQQTIQKESVFLRLSNRVKTLERNMSLSGQYLEELSRRYKKQVEEMQKSFEKTVLQMSEERRRSNERENRYLDQLSHLRQQVDDLSASVIALLEERDSWFGNVTFFKFLIYQSIIIGIALYYVSKRRKEPLVIPITKRSAKKKNQVKLRRKSVEGVSGHETPSAKKRRPSEEALRIERQSLEELNCHENGSDWQVARRTRRRKTSILHRHTENGRTNPDWGRMDSVGELRENTIPLDDDEYIAPVSEPVDFTKTAVLQGNSKKEFPKTNGSIFTNIKAKTIKPRRLSSPAFLRSFGRQSTRSTPPGLVSTPESILEGPFQRKAASESPTGSLWSASTELSQPNGRLEGAPLGKPKKRSFKNIFKKVF